MAADSSETDAEREHRIRQRAYQLWQADGAPEGQSDHYWHLARKIIDQESGSAHGSS
jgi:DUF2934 family protein